MNTQHEAFEYFEPEMFPDTHRKISGVYSIDDVYVGASKHIRKRIISHYHLLKRGHHSNKNLQKHFFSCLDEGKKIKVRYLNVEPKSEAYFSKKIVGGKYKSEKYYHETYE